jgi:hypothetical protein
MIVDGDYRGRGMGRALLAQAETWATQSDAACSAFDQHPTIRRPRVLRLQGKMNQSRSTPREATTMTNLPMLNPRGSTPTTQYGHRSLTRPAARVRQHIRAWPEKRLPHLAHARMNRAFSSTRRWTCPSNWPEHHQAASVVLEARSARQSRDTHARSFNMLRWSSTNRRCGGLERATPTVTWRGSLGKDDWLQVRREVAPHRIKNHPARTST